MRAAVKAVLFFGFQMKNSQMVDVRRIRFS